MKTAPVISLLLALTAWACPSAPIVHEPVTEGGDSGDLAPVLLQGPFHQLGPCEVLEPEDAPDGYETVSARLESGESLSGFIEAAFDFAVERLQQDPWTAWLRASSDLTLPEVGVSLWGRRTGSVDICSGERLARVEITELVGPYHLDTATPYPNPVELVLMAPGWDAEAEDVQRVWRAGQAGMEGAPETMTIEVESREEPEPASPSWRMVEPAAGFVVVEYDPPQLGTEVADEGGPLRFAGHFTGEVRVAREGLRRITLAPVFVVTGVEH